MASPGSLKACPRKVQERADGPATVLAIGTANPPNVFLQRDYPEFYFSITNSNHMTELKQKFQRMCDRSRINKRYMHLNEEILKANPSMCAYWEKSLDARQDILMVEVPKLGKEAAAKAIQEWGQPKSKITHLIFCTTSGVDMPGADWALSKLLQLRPNVQRLMLYLQGCFAGGTAIRIAKDLAENNKGARVLVVCTEINAIFFRGPSEAHPESLVGPTLFGDGAAAMILGCDAIPHIERGWFEVQYAGSSIVPNSEGALEGNLREVGLTFHLVKDLPGMIADNIGCELEEVMEAAFGEEGAPSLNDMFWIVHPGGPAILDRVEQQLRLQPEKLAPSRHVLSEFGNMSSPSVIFIMDHLRKLSLQQNAVTSGAGSEWGFLLAFGPGLTCETVLLRSLPCNSR